MVVPAGAAPPDPWTACPRFTVGEGELRQPGPVVDALHLAWLERRPVVVELVADPDAPAGTPAPRRAGPPAHPLFEFGLEHLHFLVWADNYDARGGEPVWWHARKAARRMGGGRGHRRWWRPASCWPTAPPSTSTAAHPTRRPSPRAPGVVHRWGAEAGPAPGRPLTVPRRPSWPPTSWPRSVIAPRCRPGHRPGRIGEDPGPHRAAAPSGLRSRHSPGHGQRPGLQHPGGRRDERRCSDVLTTRRSPYPDPQQPGLWICSENRRWPGPRVLEELDVRDMLAEAVRHPPPGQHRHRRPVHRRPLRHPARG